MKKVWDWIKTNWKWLIYPLWILSLILLWLLRGGVRPLFPEGIKDETVDAAMTEKNQAIQEFRKRLDELAIKAEERLQKASQEQMNEYNAIKSKSLEEVAKWIDSLS